MSISKFREFIEKPGCAWAFGIAMVFVMGFGMVFQQGGCGGGAGVGQADPADQPSVAKVGNYPVTEKAIWDMADQTLNMFAQQLGGSVPPSLVASYVGNATEQQVNAGLLLEFARRNQVSLDDKAIMAATEKALDEENNRRKQQLITDKKLSATATDAVFEAAYKKEFGQTPKEFRELVIKQYTEALKNPVQRNQILVSSANTLVMEKLMAAIPADDAAVKSTYDLYLCKRIFLKTDAHKGEDLIKKAEAIKKEIEGGLDFLAAMDKYTDDPPGPNKKKRDNEFQVDGKTAALNEAYAPITKLKPGEIGGPYSLGDGGVSIVQFNGKTNQTPADFEKNKAQLAKEYKQSAAAKKLQDGLKALKQENLIKWQSPAYHLLYDIIVFGASDEARTMDPKALRAKYEEFVKRAEEAMSDPMGSRAAPLALFQSFNLIWNQATDAEKATLKDRRIDVLKAVLDQTESAELRLELADLLAEKKDGQGVADSLRLAASTIASDFGPTGQRVFSDIQGKLIMLKSSGVLTADLEKQVREVLDQWKKDKAEHDKFEAEEKKREEEEKKKAEAEAKKEAAKKPESK